MAWGITQHSGAHSSVASTTVAKAYASNVVAGSILIAGTSWNSSGAGAATMADTQLNTWAAVSGSLVNGGFFTASCQAFWTTAGSSAANTVTATHPVSTSIKEIWLYEVTGLQASPVDTAGVIDNAVATVNITTTAADDFIVAFRTTDSMSTPSGWTKDDETNVGFAASFHKNDPTAAGSVSYASAAGGSVSVAAFKITAGAAVPVITPAFQPIPFIPVIQAA